MFVEEDWVIEKEVDKTGAVHLCFKKIDSNTFGAFKMHRGVLTLIAAHKLSPNEFKHIVEGITKGVDT